MATPQLREVIAELKAWLPNYDFEGFPSLIAEILADLPGGDELVDSGIVEKPKGRLGWKEVELLTDLLDAIDGKEDVEEVVQELFLSDEEEEGEEEEEKAAG